jgi:hypothetical protein
MTPKQQWNSTSLRNTENNKSLEGSSEKVSGAIIIKNVVIMNSV